MVGLRTLAPALTLMLAVPALLALLAGLLAWGGGEVDRTTMPAGELFVSWDVAFLHGVAALPFAFGSAFYLRRKFGAIPTDLVTSVALALFVLIAVGLRIDGSVGLSSLLATSGLLTRVLVRTGITLCIVLPGAWVGLLSYERACAEVRTIDSTSPTGLRTVAWVGCVVGFAIVTFCWGYPQILRKTNAARQSSYRLGYAMDAQRADSRLRAIAGDALVRRSYGGSMRPQLAAMLANLEQQATVTNSDAQSLLERGKALIALARHDEAATVLQQVWEQVEEPQALHQLGRNSFGQGDFQSAYDWYGKEVEALRARGERIPALAVQVSEWRAYALVQQALAAMQFVDFERTRQLLQESLSVHELAEAHLWLARTHQIVGQGRRGRIHLDRYLQLQPQNERLVLALKRELSQYTVDCAPLSPFFWK